MLDTEKGVERNENNVCITPTPLHLFVFCLGVGGVNLLKYSGKTLFMTLKEESAFEIQGVKLFREKEWL